jgi:phytoene/squalene synthetase
MGIFLLNKRFHDPIYSIYGFVRLADEIVDSFHDFDKKALLEEFKNDTYQAIEKGISLNPILNSFQNVVNHYQIDHLLIDQFLKSMEMDLSEIAYDQRGFEEYILGSAEVVGLMCLSVFTEGEKEKYLALKEPAMKLGSAFQKINFLRDIRADYLSLGRSYFPNLDFSKFTHQDKLQIEADIREDFRQALIGIKNLPSGAKLGVYTAYMYYLNLFKKIRSVRPEEILETRIRVPNWQKLLLTMRCCLSAQLRLL